MLAIAYAVLGLSAFVVYTVGSDQKFTLPLGIILPLFLLNMSFTVGRSSDLFSNAFLGMGAVLSYALTGWITGIAVALAFNFTGMKIGGINAKYVSVATLEASARPLEEKHSS